MMYPLKRKIVNKVNECSKHIMVVVRWPGKAAEHSRLP
jgi:hypothetical protein